MKMKISVTVGVKDQRTGKTKTFERTVDAYFNNIRRAAIIKVPIDAKGKEFVDVKIEEPDVSAEEHTPKVQTLQLKDKLIIANGVDPLMYVDLAKRELHKYEEIDNESQS